MKKIKHFCLFIIVVLSNSCAIHQGQFPIMFPNQVIINSPNFKIIKTVQGTSNAIYVFGIGGFDRQGLINEAKHDLYSNAKLLSNQTITNITIDYKHTLVYPIFYQKQVIISADIIEFVQLNNSTVYQESLPKINTTNPQPLTEGSGIKISEEEVKSNKINLSDDEKFIAKFIESKAQNKPTKETAYNNFDEVKTGDYISFFSPFNELVYGKVTKKVAFKNVGVKVIMNPKNGKIYTDSAVEIMNYKNLTKIEW